MAYDNQLTENILFEAAQAPKKGVDGGKAVIINWDDIDFTASTVSGEKITDLVLKSGQTGIRLEWYKDLASGNSALSASTEDVDGFMHYFLGRFPNSSAANAKRAQELKNGRFIVVYETRFKGVSNADAFKVKGFGRGMRASEMVYNTLENSGAITFTLATEEGDFEDFPFNIFLETDYTTSKATFDSLFAQA